MSAISHDPEAVSSTPVAMRSDDSLLQLVLLDFWTIRHLVFWKEHNISGSLSSCGVPAELGSSEIANMNHWSNVKLDHGKLRTMCLMIVFC
jgi:hypothetical protein